MDERLITLGILAGLGLAAGAVVHRGSVAKIGDTVTTRTGVRHVVEAISDGLVTLRPVLETDGPRRLVIPQSMIRDDQIDPGHVFAHQVAICDAGCGAEYDPGHAMPASSLLREARGAGWRTANGWTAVCPDCRGRHG